MKTYNITAFQTDIIGFKGFSLAVMFSSAFIFMQVRQGEKAVISRHGRLWFIQLRAVGSYQQRVVYSRHDGQRSGVYGFSEGPPLPGHNAHPKLGLLGLYPAGCGVRDRLAAVRLQLHAAVSQPLAHLALHPLRMDCHPRGSHVLHMVRCPHRF